MITQRTRKFTDSIALQGLSQSFGKWQCPRNHPFNDSELFHRLVEVFEFVEIFNLHWRSL